MHQRTSDAQAIAAQTAVTWAAEQAKGAPVRADEFCRRLFAAGVNPDPNITADALLGTLGIDGEVR